VQLVLGRDAVEDEARGGDERGGQHEGDAEFGPAGVVEAGLEVPVDLWVRGVNEG
jgi:hypothetical protein